MCAAKTQVVSPLTLADRVAVVTGGSRNIGFAIANRFAACGMKVAILSLSADGAAAAAGKVDPSNEAVFGLQCDVADAASVEAALTRVAERFGAIDVVVNSAGILELSKIETLSTNTWDQVMAVNVKGTFLVIQKALPYLSKSHAPRIINISSNAGRMGGFENGMAYSASKGSIISLTYGLARQLAGRRITVNCIAPGTIESDMSRSRDPEVSERLLRRFPMGRFGTADEVAAAACYFASEEAAFTTGAVLDVNGGLFMG